MPRRKPFAEFHCDRLEYEFDVDLEKVGLDDFKRDVKRIIGEAYNQEATGFSGSTATRTDVDYHSHFRFRWTRKKFSASVAFYKGRGKPDPSDPGPFTEDLVSWIGKFLKGIGQIDAEVNAYISYRLKGATALPLPMNLPVRGQDIEVRGMIFIPLAKPEGVSEIFVSLFGHEAVFVITAKRTVRFRSFDLNRDLEAMYSVSKSFAQAR